MNLASLIDPHPDDSVALISRGRITTYGTLREQVSHIRGGLIGLGFEAGDRVGIVCANNWYFVASYLAILGAGLVAVPLNPLSPHPEIERELASVGARAVVVGPSASAMFAKLDRERCPTLEVVISAAADGADDAIEGAISIDTLLAHEPAPLVPREADDLAVLIFTSGTAGHPKAAMLSHGNLLSNLDQMVSEDIGGGPNDVNFGVLPMFHIFGLNVVLGGALKVGAAVLLIERFDPVSALEAIENHGVTVILGAPTMWAAWAGIAGPSSAMATVRIATSGAARLAPEVVHAIKSIYNVDLMEGYGLTEASPVVTTTVGMEQRSGSIGVPVPDLELRLVDADGDDVLLGDSGEIWVRGPNVFKGYWNDADATRSAITEDGWLRTGDVAVVDDCGYLFLVDRAKDLIIVSGFNVYPAEVEDVLLEHPGVESCAVVGVPHPHSGEAVKAYVVAADGVALEEDALIAFCAERLARYKCPEKIMFVDHLPQGMGGKVLRRILR